jgi:hypothetical protein
MKIATYKFSLQLPKNKLENMNFASMQNITVGLFVNDAEYNITTQCVDHGFDKEMNNTCENIPGLWPNAAGSLKFFPVGRNTIIIIIMYSGDKTKANCNGSNARRYST